MSDRNQELKSSEEYESSHEEMHGGKKNSAANQKDSGSNNEPLTPNEELIYSNEDMATLVEELNGRNIELKESQDYIEAIIKTIHSPLLVLTADLRVRTANKAFYQTFMISQPETEGNFIFDLGSGAWDIPALRIHLKESFPENANFKAFALKHYFPGLGERELIVNASRLRKGEHSKETLIVMAFDDITRRFNAEASLLKSQEQLALSLIGDSIGTWWWHIPTNEMRWSTENEIINGIEEGTFVGLYEAWIERIHPDDVFLVRKEIERLIRERLPLEIEYRVIWPDKSIHWILSKGHIYFDPDGKPERMIGVSMDSTDRKMISENLENQVNLRTAELLKANNELLAVNEQLEQFAFISSHDLQEPLRKIEIFSDLLSGPSANLNDYARKYSGKINASAARMSALIKDLLSFSVLRKHDRKIISVDLNETLKNVLEDFEVTIELKKAIINRSSLPVVKAEPVQMNQLLRNLIDNALKFSKETSVITISSHAVTTYDFLKYPQLMKDTEYVSFSISDNGIGFDQKYVAKLFILFQQLIDIKGAIGTGVGLSICKRIVEDHGGFIFAHGKVNAGATFVVFLPSNDEFNTLSKPSIGDERYSP